MNQANSDPWREPVVKEVIDLRGACCTTEDDSEKARARREYEFLRYRLSLTNTLMQLREDTGLTSDDVPDLPEDPLLSQVQETCRALGLRFFWSLKFDEGTK